MIGLVLLATLAAAPTELTLISEANVMGKTRHVTLSLKGARAFFEMREDGGPSRTMLRDVEAKKMWLVDHDKKTLIMITEEDSKMLEARQEQFRNQMKAQLENLPPEQRKRIEATMLGGAGGEGAKLNLTYEKKKTPARKVAGFACDDYVIKKDGKPHGEGCFTAWKNVGFTAEEFKALMLKAMPTAASAGPMLQAFEASGSAPGLPVERALFDEQGAVTTKTELKSIAKTALPAENFELPKGYVEKTMAEGMKRPGPVAGPQQPGPAPTPPPSK